MAGRQLCPLPAGVVSALVAGFVLMAASSSPALAQKLQRQSNSGYSSARFLEPRPLTIRPNKRRVPRAQKPAALPAAGLLCPTGKNLRAPCVSPRLPRNEVTLIQAPGADAFRLGSASLAPPQVSDPDPGQSPPLLNQSIIFATLRPPIYPDILKPVPAFGAAARPPIYPGLFGRQGFGYFLPFGGGFNSPPP